MAIYHMRTKIISRSAGKSALPVQLIVLLINYLQIIGSWLRFDNVLKLGECKFKFIILKKFEYQKNGYGKT